MAPNYELRPADAGDLAYAWRLYEDLMRARTEALMPWRAERQREVIESALGSGGMRMIAVDGTVCGWLHVHEAGDGIDLLQLYVAREHQNGGIGTDIVSVLQARAAALGRPLRLNVLINNPARRLYERLGFRIERSDAVKHHMAWSAAGASAEA
jgi:ribosomal protein S18 acetylase RimI-like enzyme